MSQLKCPVCTHEYTEGAEFCSRCYYLLTTYSSNLLAHPEVQEREKKRLQSAKDAWRKYYHAYSESKQLKQQLEASKKDNQSLPNNSLLEQYLQDISSKIDDLPQIVNLLQQISQHLAYQSENFYNFSQSQQVLHQENHTSVTPIVSENQVDTTNETNAPSNFENSNINNDANIDDIVQNYNQDAYFPDKIEVSETASSKEKRWVGSQEAPILELNHRNRGEYWIINNQYLVPKPKLKINEHNYKTVAALFECYNYENNATDNMSLVKPAKVRFIYGEEKWQLEEMGSLQF